RGHLAYAREQLQITESRERKRAFEQGTTRAFCLVNTTTDVQDLLQPGMAVLEETLGRYGVLERDDWQNDPHWLRLDPQERRRLAEDVRELLPLLGWARVKQAPDDPATLRGALALLDRAEALRNLPPSPALFRDRARYLTRLGDKAGAQAAEDQAREIR